MIIWHPIQELFWFKKEPTYDFLLSWVAKGNSSLFGIWSQLWSNYANVKAVSLSEVRMLSEAHSGMVRLLDY